MASAPLKPTNRLLASLPPEALKALRPHLEPVELPLREVLFNVDVPIEHVYFPEDAVVSILGVMPDGTAIEVATVGREGMVGLPVFLGVQRTPAHALVQVPGRGLRVRAQAFREHVQRTPGTRNALDRYTQAMFTLVAQGAACNRLHSIEERCARWLLMTQDRVGADGFPLTQQFLSQMLGVRRAGVSEVASELQREGLLKYQRGYVSIQDRAGLEAASCECYGVIRSEFSRLLEGQESPSPLTGVSPRFEEKGQSTAKDGTPRPRRKPGSRARSKRD
ncbi:Crp/Fnr family transcriptional regulator [Pyxidicoccus sp. 3LFB2]